MTKLIKCENCTGELKYHPDKEQLRCDRCGSGFNIKVTKGVLTRNYDPNYNPLENKSTDSLYKCSTCQSKMIVGSDAVRTRCSSCGNATLVKEKTIEVTPDGILPFKTTRKKAAEIFRNWVAKRKFAPNDLVQMAKLEKISGIYTPVYNFNYSWIFNYSATGVEKKLDAYYNEYRDETYVDKMFTGDVENEVYSASARIPNKIIGILNDYDFRELKPFSTEYLLGFSGVDTTENLHKIYGEIQDYVNEQNKAKATRKLNDEFDYYEDFESFARLKNVKYNYAYVPVWANHYTYKGKECYTCFFFLLFLSILSSLFNFIFLWTLNFYFMK